ncbi:MAG: hypothetical protein ABSC14_10525 [Desulfomonilia bacterium]
MYQRPVHFMTIRITLPGRSIYARLGFKKGVTELKGAQKDKVDKAIDEAAEIIHLKGAARMVNLMRIDAAGVELEDGVLFSSGALKSCSWGRLQGRILWMPLLKPHHQTILPVQ